MKAEVEKQCLKIGHSKKNYFIQLSTGIGRWLLNLLVSQDVSDGLMSFEGAKRRSNLGQPAVAFVIVSVVNNYTSIMESSRSEL
jgi:hypothetical protein